MSPRLLIERDNISFTIPVPGTISSSWETMDLMVYDCEYSGAVKLKAGNIQNNIYNDNLFSITIILLSVT